LEFIEAIEAMEASLSWTPDPNSDPEEKVRVFCVPPEWYGYFYNRVLATACVRVRYFSRSYRPSTDPDTEYGFCHMVINSIDDSGIGMAGPDEPASQARQRAENLMSRMSGQDIPPWEELMSIAAECGCEVDRW